VQETVDGEKHKFQGLIPSIAPVSQPPAVSLQVVSRRSSRGSGKRSEVIRLRITLR
jgi:hypothetical protein